jgi:L-alanine-DL-glutamate epimerase-like enolase superfamily enzyme
MRDTARAARRPSAMGRRDFLRTVGAASVGAAGLAAVSDPFKFARAAITPGEKGIYITDLCTATIKGLNNNCTIIRLDTNKGISGYGECRCEDTSSMNALRALKPTILGMNPTQVEKVFNAIKTYGDPFGTSNRNLIPRKTGAMSGIEVACWDITGKVYNVPIWKLIGPKLRDRVRLYADTPQQNSESALQSAVQARLKEGFTWFKMDLAYNGAYPALTSGTDYTTQTADGYPYKCVTITSSGMAKLLGYAKLYRSMIGTAPLSSDHDTGWSGPNYLDVESAVLWTSQMYGNDYQGPYGGWMEDIIPWYYASPFNPQYPLLDQIHSKNQGVPILSGEDMYCTDELYQLIDAGVVDIIHPDQSSAGGIRQSRLAGNYAHAKGIKTALHMSGSPFTLAASLHIAAGIPDFLAMEHHYSDLSWYDGLVDGIAKPIMQSDGCAIIPDGPGLGIKPNETNMRAHLTGSYFAPLT